MIAAALLICLAPITTDGDTLVCGRELGGKTSIRLFGVNSVDGTSEDAAAKARLGQLSTGGLTCEPKGTSYSRIVAICFNAAGVDVGKQLIAEKLASEWCSYTVSRQYPQGYYGTCP